MDEERPLFILAGNGPYTNRECEAIVRGPTKIFREHFKDPRFPCVTHIQSEE
jgi:colanic acid/amylovoran biosynthesis protein